MADWSPAEGLDVLANDLAEIYRRLKVLEEIDGATYGQTVRKILALFENLDQQVQDAIEANSMTTDQIHDYVAAPPTDVAVDGDLSATGKVTAGAAISAAGDIQTSNTTGLLRSVGSRNFIVSTGYAGAWINVDGTIGISPSSRRFKGAEEDWSFDPVKLLEVQAKSFVYSNTPVPFRAERQVGFIAEDLEELGLTAFLFYNADGQVEGILYDRLTVALFVLAQWQEQRISAIEQRLAAAGI